MSTCTLVKWTFNCPIRSTFYMLAILTDKLVSIRKFACVKLLGRKQCGQMLKYKVGQKKPQHFYLNIYVFQNSPKRHHKFGLLL